MLFYCSCNLRVSSAHVSDMKQDIRIHILTTYEENFYKEKNGRPVCQLGGDYGKCDGAIPSRHG